MSPSRLLPLALVAFAAAGGVCDEPRGAPDESEALFSAAEPPRFEVELSAKALESLRQAPKTGVEARLTVRGLATFERVGVKLKGAAGSFRPVDDRPALTLHLERYDDRQRLHGVKKLHLNNSVQDGTFLQEALSAQLFAAAGLPAPRVGFARVALNGRDLGLYVLKEGVDRRFLRRHFADATGNLYDGGFCADLDQALERDEGSGPVDRADLASLVAACREPDLTRRGERLEAAFDLPRFLRFLALERMLAHWDGYGGNRNNYRVYFEPPAGRAVLLPQGMDQLFGDPNFPLYEGGAGLAFHAVLDVPELRARYRQQLTELLPLFHADQSLLPRVARLSAAPERALREVSAEATEAWYGARRDLIERLRARAARLPDLVQRPDPAAPAFDADGVARVEGFQAVVHGGTADLSARERDGRPALEIATTGGDGVASWRRRVVLPRGRYLWTGEAATADVRPRDPDGQGPGAGLRVSGSQRPRGLEGTTTWTRLEFLLEVAEERRVVELVCELRARSGTAWFDAASLRLLRQP